MEYTEFTPPAEAPASSGPSKADLIMQIEADHYTESQKESPNAATLEALTEKHAAVLAAEGDEAARDAYNSPS